MFAVPGWAVSPASLKTQTASSQPAPIESLEDTNRATLEGAPKSSKKRKRRHDKPKSNGVVVTSDNLAELWAKHIEGNGAEGELNGSMRSSKKRRKTEPNELAAAGGDLNGKLTSRDGARDIETGFSKSKIAKASKDGGKNLTAGSRTDTTQEKVESHKSREDEPRPKPRRGKTLKEKKREKKAAHQTSNTNTPTTQPSSQTNTDPQSPTAITQPPSIPTPHTLPPISNTQLTPLQASMRSKLTSARFRHLNQTLYTTPSSTSLTLFEQNPSLFTDYHAGFRQQVSIWPTNPVDNFISTLKTRGGAVRQPNSSHGKGKKAKKPNQDTKLDVDEGNPPLPRTDGVCVVADLGCGDARLAISLNTSGVTQKVKLKILSFDLYSESKEVTKADIASLPLENGSVDVAIFCLALMGTNWIDFIEEAWRVLRLKGELWVAEIKSRFGRVVTHKEKRIEHSVGNKKKKNPVSKADRQAQEAEDENAELAVEVDGAESGKGGKGGTDVAAFVEVLRKRGFVLQGESAVDLSNKMFVKMGFVKALTPTKGKCVPADKGGQAKEGETWKRKAKTKFLDERDGEGDEAKVLKPCVYKLR
ncbi:MAG: 25S rRNA (adenine645-N1)-methyltransferase [Candelina mexicana]|nr:MAG: 25S rRNA (adenine645-N1)-methyltransferase [Candelina mexicana]